MSKASINRALKEQRRIQKEMVFYRRQMKIQERHNRKVHRELIKAEKASRRKNKTNQAFKSAQNTKVVKDVWKVWARDNVTIKRYKPDGRRRY
jgi:hypothetical protein